MELHPHVLPLEKAQTSYQSWNILIIDLTVSIRIKMVVGKSFLKMRQCSPFLVNRVLGIIVPVCGEFCGVSR